ncbi:hypothetical protein CHUAL_001927 [Chamberlinius hualienensis]
MAQFKYAILLLAFNLTTNLGFPAAIPIAYHDAKSTTDSWKALSSSLVEYMSSFSSVDAGACDACKVVAAAVKTLVREDKTQNEIAVEAAGLCTAMGIEDAEVCYLAMSNWLPEVIYIANLTGAGYSPNNICGMLYPSCVIESEFLPVFDWNVTFPSPEPPYVPPPQPSPTAPKLRILHISDTHYDPQYLEGSVSNCNEPLCCRSGKISPSSNVSYAGKYGGLHGTCDIPQITLESMLEYAAENLEFDFVYWTGDIPPHDIWNQTKGGNLQQLRSTADIVHRFIPSTKTVYPSCGNHEAEPCNSYPVPPVYQDFNISYLYNELDTVWSTFVPNLQHDTVLKGGYYATDILPGLRLISLNTNYGGKGNWWLFVENDDPTEELQWLISQLDDAEKNNIKVHIIGHMPPGETVYVWSRNYRDILERYKGTIAGHFYGHTHDDHFEIVYDDVDTSQPISVAHIGPSVTTYANVNPSFRIYTIDGDYNETTWSVLDYEVYWLDVDRANADGFATWELRYSAKDAYGMNDMSPEEFNNFVNRMETDDALFQTFYENLYRVSPDTPCVDTCKSAVLCNLRLGWSGYSKDCNGG